MGVMGNFLNKGVNYLLKPEPFMIQLHRVGYIILFVKFRGIFGGLGDVI